MAVRKRKAAKLLVDALSIIFYKVPLMPGYDRDEYAQFLIAELYDKGIYGIEWDSKVGEFRQISVE